MNPRNKQELIKLVEECMKETSWFEQVSTKRKFPNNKITITFWNRKIWIDDTCYSLPIPTKYDNQIIMMMNI